MKRGLLGLVAVALIAGWAVQTADAWIITREVNSAAAGDQSRFNVKLDTRDPASGVGIMFRNDGLVGGHDALTNAFVDPFRTVTKSNSDAPNSGPAADSEVQTVVRYVSLSGGTLAPSASQDYFFGLSGYDNGRPQTITHVYWDNCGDPADIDADASAATEIPGLSVSFVRTDAATVEVTVTNAMASTIAYTDLSGSSVAYGSVSAASLNSTDFPCSGGTSGSLDAGTSTSFSVAAGLTDDVVVCYNASWAVNGSTSTNWHAMDSGNPALLKDAYLGRFILSATQISAGMALNTQDSRAKGPFKRISGRNAGMPQARFTPMDVEGVGALGEILIDTVVDTDPSPALAATPGLKRSYLRTNGGDVYTDVKVHARVTPGAEVGDTDACGNAITSADTGGPIALDIQPGDGGGSYYASVSSGRPNEISIYRDNGDGTSTQLCTTANWDGAAGAIDIDFAFAGATSFIEDAYDIDFANCGGTLTLDVAELAFDTNLTAYFPTGRTVSITCQDSTYTQGYVGIRSERDGSLDATGACPSNFFEGTVKQYKIQPCQLTGPLAGKRVLYVGGSDSRTDGTVGWTSRGSRSGVMWAGHTKEMQLTVLGADVNNVGCAEFAGMGNATVNSNYDMLYVDGSCSSSSSKDRIRCIEIGVMYGEHAGSKCTKWGGALTQSGDTPSSEAHNLGRVLPASDGGVPTHPIVLGLPVDGADSVGRDGAVNIKFYDEPEHHLQSTSQGGGVTMLIGRGASVNAACGSGGYTIPTGKQVFSSGERMCYVGAAEAGDPICSAVACDSACGCPTNYIARQVWFGWGDYAPRLSPCGLALYQRSAIWLTGGDPSVIPMPGAECIVLGSSEPTPVSAIPAMTNWGVALMTVLLLASAVTVLRRRRTVTA